MASRTKVPEKIGWREAGSSFPASFLPPIELGCDPENQNPYEG